MAFKFNPLIGALEYVTATTPPSIGGSIVGGTAGSVLFVGAGPVFAQDNARLYWDSTAFRLKSGNGVSFPTAGAAITAASYSIGRDATATNAMYFNVPTGAAFKFTFGGLANANTGLVYDVATGFQWHGASGRRVNFYESAAGPTSNAAQLYVADNDAQTGAFLFFNSSNGTSGVGSYSSFVDFGIYTANTSRITLGYTGHHTIQQGTATTSGTSGGCFLTLTTANNTGLTGSAEQSQLIFSTSTQQWATGALTLQRFVQFQAQSIAFVGASTVSDCIGVDFADVVAGTNATITRGASIRVGNAWLNGSQRVKRSASAAGGYTVLLTDYIIGKTGITGGGDTVTLPSAVTAAGYTYVIKDESGGALVNNITVTAAAGNINGAASVAIITNYGSVSVYSDGANWFTF